MQQITSCKVCHNTNITTVKTYKIINQTVWPWNEVYGSIKNIPFPLSIRLGLCQECGFLFYRDSFTYKEMKQFYETEARYTKPKKHKLKPGRIWELDQLLIFLKRHVPLQRIKTALDLGAGDFIALDRITNLAPNVTFEAVDPSYPNSQHNKIKVHRKMIEDLNLKKHFDFVSAIHILEHVGDLHHFLTKANALTKPNGYFYVEVPFQVAPSLFLNRSVSVQHVNYFTPETLCNLLSRHEFLIKQWEFDKGSYSKNGMAGMIRVLAIKQNSILYHSTKQQTLQYLFNPFSMLRSGRKAYEA